MKFADFGRAVLSCIRRGVRADAAAMIEAKISDVGAMSELGLPTAFLKATAAALRTDMWNEVGAHFGREDFMGARGQFLLLGPYTSTRDGRRATSLSGVAGTRIQTPASAEIEIAIAGSGLAAKLWSPNNLIPFSCIDVCGLTSGPSGEAFLVPDAWAWGNAFAGPALNNMTMQRERYSHFASSTIPRFFSSESAHLLLDALSDENVGVELQHRDFAYHEAGHATGIGLQEKLRHGVLNTHWHRGVEEWRADGVEFELLALTLQPNDMGRTIAANFSLRFGIDAHRTGGAEGDTDVIATLLTLGSLLRSDAITIDSARRLTFAQPTYAGLARAVLQHRSSAVALTRAELLLQNVQGVSTLYDSVRVEPTAKAVLIDLIREPCRHLVAGLL